MNKGLQEKIAKTVDELFSLMGAASMALLWSLGEIGLLVKGAPFRAVSLLPIAILVLLVFVLARRARVLSQLKLEARKDFERRDLG